MTDASGAQGQGGTGEQGQQGQANTGATNDQGQQQQANTQGQQAQGTQQQGAAFGAGAQGGQQQGQQASGDTDGDAALAARFPGFATFPAEAQAALRARDAEARRYQREAGDERINAKNNAAAEGQRKALAEVAKLAGLDIPGLTDTDDGEADPKALAAQINTTAQERDAARKDLATVKAAYASGVDPARLGYLQYLLTQDKGYQALTLDASDFDAKLVASINGLLAADATLRLTGTAQASGVETLGGSGGVGEITPEQFSRMSISDRQNLYHTDKATYDRLVAAQ